MRSESPDRSRRQSCADTGGGISRQRGRQRFEDVLGDDTIDIVSIASFDDAHFAQVMAALRAGKHVFVEKPLCRTAAELSDIRGALTARAGSASRQQSGAAWRRSLPLAACEIASGAFGDIYAFDGDCLWPAAQDHGWLARRNRVLFGDAGRRNPHDRPSAVAHRPAPERCAAAGSRLATRDTQFRYDDFTAATLTFSSGLVARISANFACMHPHQHVVRIFGTRRTFILDDAGPRVLDHRDPPERGMPIAKATPLQLATKPEHKGALIPDFVRGIVEGAPAQNRERDATLDAIAIAAACDEAAVSTNPVNIAYH